MSLTFSMFQESLEDCLPPEGLSSALKALWWAARSDIAAAMDIVAAHPNDPECLWVRAWLQRRDGEHETARASYRRAGQTMGHGDLMDEWRSIVIRLLSGSGY